MGFSRSRPLLGTFVTLTSEAGSAESPESAAMTAAFQEAERLQTIFSAIDPDSILSRYNAKASQCQWPYEFTEILARAEDLRQRSADFFNPRRIDGAIDLAGIAKGEIVDRVADVLLSADPDFRGVVNAGGDLRFVGAVELKVTVRIGALDAPLLREMILCAPHVAFASSSLSVSRGDEKSSTHYHLPLAEDLTSLHTVCVAASECWIADALTKVALHAPSDVADRVAREYDATIVVFDAAGAVAAVRGKS